MTQEIKLPGLRLNLKPPRVVAENWGFCWYPDIRKFATGELLLGHSLNADSGANAITAQALYFSSDEGQTWKYGYDINGFHPGGGEVRISLPGGAIVGPGYAGARPDPAGQQRRFTTHYWRFEEGGRRYSVDTWGAVIEGLPRDVELSHSRSRWALASISLFGTAVEVTPRRYITTCCVRYDGDTRETLEAIVSEDSGRTWHYLSTIAGPDALLDAKEGFDEPCMIKLAEGDLMCVSRVGGGRDQPLGRAYSSDGGKSWSQADRLPAWSVAPSMAQVQNGVIAVSTGRPGIFLWLSTDARGQNWQSVDVIAFHNATLDPSHRMSAGRAGLAVVNEQMYLNDHFDYDEPWQTTSYTALLEVSPNRLFMVYDRLPYGWMPIPSDAEIRSRIMLHYPERPFAPNSFIPKERNRIYLLEIEVERE